MKKKFFWILSAFVAIAQVGWSQSTDSVAISSREYALAQKNLKAYRQLISEHKALQTAYSDLRQQFERLLIKYKASQKPTAEQLSLDQLQQQLSNQEKEIEMLRKSILYCQSQLNKARKKNARKNRKPRKSSKLDPWNTFLRN
jgi:peptidoglycan hydrolase CwlO-like protein